MDRRWRAVAWSFVAFVANACTIVTTQPAPAEPTGPIACGNYPGATCPEGAYCHFEPEDRCGETGVMGSCRPGPEACTAVVAPVCGCDRQTHRNACEAARAGTSVLASGPCEELGQAPTGEPEGEFCGGIQGLPCPDGQFCQFEGCHPDAGGTCQPQPEACIQVHDPVCGCDGRSYMNACAAHANGMTVQHRGQCQAGSSPPAPGTRPSSPPQAPPPGSHAPQGPPPGEPPVF